MIIHLHTYRKTRSKQVELQFYNAALQNNIAQKNQIDPNIAVIENIIKII